jgi:hypothetical protein
MLNVFITVDAEFCPLGPDVPREEVAAEMATNVYGRVRGGEFGIGYMMRVMGANGIKGNFFVESLCASVFGSEILEPVVRGVQSAGHDVQLHVHTEWVKYIGQGIGFGVPSANIKNFSRGQQSKIITQAKQNLRNAGAGKIDAFRAGNYGASFETLEALRENGISYDTSYNQCYLRKACDMQMDEPLTGPMKVDGVVEVPITSFRDVAWHFRPLQLNACSFGEMRRVCMQAWQENWPSLVLVMHSFELLTPRRNGIRRPDRIAVKRFERLCSLLGSNKDKFNTRLFSRLEEDPLPCSQPGRPLHTGAMCTARRCWEQFLRRTGNHCGFRAAV